MSLQVSLSERDRSILTVEGSFVEVRWTSTHRLAKRQCEKCVYLVRGAAPGMICLELIYDSIDGEHRQDAVYWVPIESVQYLRVLTEREAHRRIESLEKEMMEEMPRD